MISQNKSGNCKVKETKPKQEKFLQSKTLLKMLDPAQMSIDSSKI